MTFRRQFSFLNITENLKITTKQQESKFFPRETQPDLMGVKSLIKVEIQGIKGDIKPGWTFLLLLTCPTRQINHDIDVKLQNTDRQNKYLAIYLFFTVGCWTSSDILSISSLILLLLQDIQHLAELPEHLLVVVLPCYQVSRALLTALILSSWLTL